MKSLHISALEVLQTVSKLTSTMQEMNKGLSLKWIYPLTVIITFGFLSVSQTDLFCFLDYRCFSLFLSLSPSCPLC